MWNNTEAHVDRYDIAKDLSVNVTPVPVDSGAPWIAEDLDMDGEVELLVQWYDEVRIYSAPDWQLRAKFVWPGTNVILEPTTFQLDSDPYREVYATPHFLFGGGYAAVIDYDPVTDSFYIASELVAPNGVAGRSAVADFDDDGRVEFITGNNDFGYELFEWQDSELVYIGSVGDSLDGAIFSAVACRPMPDKKLRALVGYAGTINGYFYELLETVADNEFVIAHVFTGSGGVGVHPCGATDTDCDGLDELAMLFPPAAESWEWDVDSNAFVQTCVWDFPTFGTTTDWYPVDLDQDGRPEWGALNHLDIFRAFPAADCTNCDSTGRCPIPGPSCHCACANDPMCDSVTNVLDVVAAVNVAFRGEPETVDPVFACPGITTDADCDGVTNVLDVVRMVNVAFRGADPAVEFCDPCQ